MVSEQNENNQQSLGLKIQELRKSLGLTQEALARKADVPYTSLTKIESGAIKNPSFQIVSKIAAGLEVSIDSLVTSKTINTGNL